jgi:hypothetical protein
MQRLVLSFILIVATLFLFAPTQQAKPVLREKFYKVILVPCGFGWYGKPPDGTVMGEWYVDCDGNWDGWGWHPGDSCTDTEITLGAQCYQ